MIRSTAERPPFYVPRSSPFFHLSHLRKPWGWTDVITSSSSSHLSRIVRLSSSPPTLSPARIRARAPSLHSVKSTYLRTKHPTHSNKAWEHKKMGDLLESSSMLAGVLNPRRMGDSSQPLRYEHQGMLPTLSKSTLTVHNQHWLRVAQLFTSNC